MSVSSIDNSSASKINTVTGKSSNSELAKVSKLKGPKGDSVVISEEGQEASNKLQKNTTSEKNSQKAETSTKTKQPYENLKLVKDVLMSMQTGNSTMNLLASLNATSPGGLGSSSDNAIYENFINQHSDKINKAIANISEKMEKLDAKSHPEKESITAVGETKKEGGVTAKIDDKATSDKLAAEIEDKRTEVTELSSKTDEDIISENSNGLGGNI